jgi:hypothetical protein
LLSIIHLNSSKVKTSRSDLNKTETANLMTTITPLLYIKDQVMNCLSVKKPESYSDCGPMITDPRASCCYTNVSFLFRMCFPVPTDYPALYKHIFKKFGLSVHCPLINNFNGTYNDTLIENLKLTPEDAQYIMNSAYEAKTDLTPLALKCAEVSNPVSYDSCKSAIINPAIKCCYVNGKRGNDTVNTCMVIPEKAQKQMNDLFTQVGASLQCETH